ncbi:MAG: radical SAM protein [Deltaproteobacteria bacterium]|nr:radical SAM protein [Deltaproteobacteria bacterium]
MSVRTVFKPTKRYVEPSVESSPLASRVGAKPLVQPPALDDLEAKRTLVLAENKGPFLRPCPGTQNYICCGYQILHVGTGCPLNCSYCILQSYLNDHRLRVFANQDRLIEELKQEARSHPDRLFRLGTGEFTDSLYIEHLVRFVDRIVPVIQGEPNLMIEFKTKTDNIGTLLELDDPDRIVVSFSMNSRRIVRSEEHGAASLEQRLRAAERCRARGFKLGFHFDPIIHYPGWEAEYGETIRMIFDHVDPAGVIWISLGCLRYMPDLKVVARKRHPQSAIFSEEFIRGLDGKTRYFRPIRQEIYAGMAARLRRADPDLCVYLCMESDLVWRSALNHSPETGEGLARILDRRAFSFFPSLRVQDSKKAEADRTTGRQPL